MTPTDLRHIQDHDFTKEQTAYEYETKFQIHATRKTSFQLLSQVRTCFKTANSPFMLCSIKGGDLLRTNVTFFLKGKTEYSLFTYRGLPMLKVKRHRILKGKRFPVFKNDETLLIDRQTFSKKPALHYRFKRHHYELIDLQTRLETLKKHGVTIGDMTKERVKDFVFDPRDGRIYAVAITFCTCQKKLQKQLEIEYAGYLPNYKHAKRESQKELLAGVEAVSAQIQDAFPHLFTPSVERKFTFVTATLNQRT